MQSEPVSAIVMLLILKIRKCYIFKISNCSVLGLNTFKLKVKCKPYLIVLNS